MRRLLLDVGNSRVKWALADSLDDMQAFEHGGDLISAFRRIMSECGDLDELVYTDVTGRLAGAIPEEVQVHRLEATAKACGVTNAYPHASQLGADRWAALIGTHAVIGGAACIIDAGTALTADVLAADGCHLGGWIAPGQRLGIEALAVATRLPAASGPVVDTPLATDTGTAIAAGTMAAALGFVERARAAAEQALGIVPVLVLTGGDARILANGPGEVRVIENLVLIGLARWVEAS